MKAVWFLTFLSTALVQGKNVDNVVVIPQEFVPAIIKASSECIEKYNMPADTLQKVFDEELDDSENGKKYLHCLGCDTGYLDVSGNIVKDKVLQIVGPYKKKVNAVVDECNQIKYSDEFETAYRRIMCFYIKSEIHFKT
ncbi:unnamed protein product, partial [Brenthis ino]